MARLDKEKAQALGKTKQSEFEKYKSDRKEIETQMMKNLRQHRGKYDPDVASKLKPGRSKVYPRDTRQKVQGFVAKMMEMMFPTEGKNWGVKPTPLPTIAAEDLDQILRNLEEEVQNQVQAQITAAEAEGRRVTPEPIEITSAMVESAVMEFAEERAANMERECDDQLSEMEITYPKLAKAALRSGAIYGFGVTKGPVVKFKKDRIWKKDAAGVFQAQEVRLPRPMYRPMSSWDFYPDLAAPSWQEQNAIYERRVFTRHGFGGLVKLKGFENDAIKEYLQLNTDGNYKEPNYATELSDITQTGNVSGKKERRYEVIVFRGFVTAHELVGLGLEVKEERKHEDHLVDLWMIDDTIIKLDQTPFGNVPADFYHPYIHGEDEDSGLLGVGLPEDVRDSQLSICATSRMMQDNAAAVAGPIWEANKDLIARGYDINSIRAFSVVPREGMGAEAQFAAVRQLNTDSHITELGNLLKQHRETMDIESNLPAWMFGAAQPLGEAFRTSSNMSMMQGGANMITKDNVRSFDTYVLSLIGSVIKWNGKFNKKTTIHGDFEAAATGNQSLVAKELRGAALDQFWLTLDDGQKAMFDEYGVLQDRMEARDLPTKRLKKKDEAEEAAAAVRAAAAAAASAEQELTSAKTGKLAAETQATEADTQIAMEKLEPELRKLLSEVGEAVASAKEKGDSTQIQSMGLVLNQLANRGGAQEGGV